MPRRQRIFPGGFIYHVMNRAAGRLILFESAADYAAFESLLHAALAHNAASRGAVYQGRYKAIPVQSGKHLTVVWRYVERNAVTARLVTMLGLGRGRACLKAVSDAIAHI